MKFSKKTAKKAAGAVLGVSALAGIASYMTTSLFAKEAFDRREPQIMKKAGNRIAGTQKDNEFEQRQKAAAEMLSQAPTEQVTITAQDGTNLVGHWYPCDGAKRVVIAMHGWRSSWCSDFGLTAEFLHANHCSVLFAEQRGQNSSGGDYMGFGVTEQFDCLDWVHWAVQNKSAELPIYLYGVSMGATTVLMAAGLNMPEAVHGVIADCGFTSPDAIWKHIARSNLHIPYRLQRVMAGKLYGRRNPIGGFRYSTTEALQNCSTPVLLIHGDSDHFVPIEMTYQNYDACTAPKRLLVVPGADHARSYFTAPEEYEDSVRDFWREFDATIGA